MGGPDTRKRQGDHEQAFENLLECRFEPTTDGGCGKYIVCSSEPEGGAGGRVRHLTGLAKWLQFRVSSNLSFPHQLLSAVADQTLDQPG